MITLNLNQFHLSKIDTIVFAGGGNRCWWQAGVLSELQKNGWSLPCEFIGTSAGAAIAAACIGGGLKTALDSCLKLYSENERIFNWHGLKKLKLVFAHQHIYPSWIESFVNAESYQKLLNSSTKLKVAMTRPAWSLGLSGSIFAGTVAYVVDRYIWNSVHPRLPKWLGLKQDFKDIKQCATLVDVQVLLQAAAAAPPFMLAQRIGNSAAIDGGYTDNAPIPMQTQDQRSKTLVLLTRHYEKLPQLFRWNDRIYWQPSQRVPVSTWDCTQGTTVLDAFGLGEQDVATLVGKRIWV